MNVATTAMARATVVVFLVSTSSAAQGHTQHRGEQGAFGTVHFATSCDPAVAGRFDRGASTRSRA